MRAEAETVVATKAAAPAVRRKASSFSLSRLLLHTLLMIGSLLFLFPFLWTISSSLKDMGQIFMIPPTWIPDPFVWSNFSRTLTAMPFNLAYFNSFYISIVVVAAQLLTCSMAGYAFAKIRFRGSKVIFIAFIATMMVPKQVIIIALYVFMKQINWVDSHLALIMPEALFKAFGVFMLMQFIKGLPNELQEAAVIDGANPLQIYGYVILPLTRTALAAFGIFAFKDIWNQFMEPLIFLSTPEKYTVPLMLNMFKGLYVADWPLMMAGTAIAVTPVLIVYLLAQRQIIEGIAMTGSKG